MWDYRFDSGKKRVLFRNDTGQKTSLSYDKVFDTFNYIACNSELRYEIQDHVFDKVLYGKHAEDEFSTFIKSLRKIRSDDFLWKVIVDNLQEFALYHNDYLCHHTSMILNDERLTAKWYKANIKRRFEQAERMLLFLEYPRNDVQLDGDYMFVPVRCKSESGVFYYYSECSELFLPTFVFHFLTALQLNALQPCKCRGCGNLFCGKTEEISCSKVACKKRRY